MNQPVGDSLQKIFDLAGVKMFSYKLLHKDQQLDKDATVDKLFDSEKGLHILAWEVIGKPSVWKRFGQVYTDGSISNYYYYEDSIYFVPQKDILLAGFASWAPKDGNPFQLKYKCEVDGNIIQEDDNPTQYDNFEDTYYVKIWLDKPYEVKKGQKIKLRSWYALNFANTSWAYLYTGNDGDNWASHPNEHMGLFQVESSETTNGYTYVSSGQWPEIYYYL